MQSTRLVVAVLVLVGCMIIGCTKDIPPTGTYIPDAPALPTGSGVFTASIDGASWVAQDGAGVPSGTSTYSGTILHVSGGRAVDGGTADGETIDLVIDLTASRASIVPGTYALGSMPAQDGEARHGDGLSCVCRTNGAFLGSVTITGLDAARKVVSGTFDFDGIGTNGQTHVVREGKFDVRWE